MAEIPCLVRVREVIKESQYKKGTIVGLAAINADQLDRDLHVVVRLDMDFGLLRLVHFSDVLVDEESKQPYEAHSLLSRIHLERA